jgi:hypothetical protein
MFLHPGGREPYLFPVFLIIVRNRRSPAHGLACCRAEPPLEIADLAVGLGDPLPHGRDLFPEHSDFLLGLFSREPADFPPKLGYQVRHVSSYEVLSRTCFRIVPIEVLVSERHSLQSTARPGGRAVVMPTGEPFHDRADPLGVRVA